MLMEKKEDNGITKEVFEYVTSKEFSDRVEAIYNNASRVRQEVQKIRNYNERGLSAVGKLVSGISENTVGIAGDLQGLSLSSDNLLSTINLKLKNNSLMLLRRCHYGTSSPAYLKLLSNSFQSVLWSPLDPIDPGQQCQCSH